MEKINELTTIDQWEELLERTIDTSIVVFKHSTSCMISARAFRQVKALDGGDSIDYYLVKVIENRAVSKKIAEDTSVTHKSPQILLIYKKQVLWNTSHWKITKSNIEKEISKLLG